MDGKPLQFTSELQYDPTTYQFFATVGFGEGGSLLGHTMYYTTKIFFDKNISLKQEYSNGLQLGTARHYQEVFGNQQLIFI